MFNGMEGSNTRFVNASDCLSEPDVYRLCPDTTCIPVAEHCPCQAGELRCLDGRCLPYHDICIATKPCGEFDKEYCARELDSGLPISVAVVIVTASFVLCTVLIILLCLFFARRKRNDTSQESQTALKEGEIQSETRPSDSTDRNFKTRHKQSGETNVIKWNDSPNSSIIHVPDTKIEHKETDGRTKSSANNQTTRETKDKSQCLTHNKIVSDISGRISEDTITKMDESFIDSGVNLGTSEETNLKLGQYVYKPRSRKPPTIYHSYVPSHTEPSTPTSVDFDREKIPFLFAQEFLCASTPRQVVKQFMFRASPDIEFMDEC